MTAPFETVRGCPPPRWTELRDAAPEIADDLVDLWARVEHSTELRWLVEHLGGLVEATVAELDAWRDEQDGCGVDVRSAEATDPVFCPDGWAQVAPGRWENEAGSFEASIDAVTRGGWAWQWQLWRHTTTGELVRVADGTARTLLDAQRQADTKAQHDRNWRTER